MNVQLSAVSHVTGKEYFYAPTLLEISHVIFLYNKCYSKSVNDDYNIILELLLMGY